jgi:hypothetical protein
MYPFENTSMENYEGQFIDIRQFFHEQGYDEGGNWDYDHGYFDRKLADSPGYLFIRVPVFVKEGEFGDDEAFVRLGKPFLLRHKYQVANDDYVDMTVINATYNQFAEPEDADATVTEEEVAETKEIIRRLDQAFRERFLDHAPS